MDIDIDIDMKMKMKMNMNMNMNMNMDKNMDKNMDMNVNNVIEIFKGPFVKNALAAIEVDVPDVEDYFNKLPDEIIMCIFKFLPKESLLNCNMVCRRFYRCSKDEHLWTHMEFINTNIKSGAIENILKCGVKKLSIERTALLRPVFERHFLSEEPDYVSKLVILDLRGVDITKPSLIILLSLCPKLKELCLENIPINDDVCIEISRLSQLLCLSIINCNDIEARGVRKMLTRLHDLCYLNMSSPKLSFEVISALVTNITSNILRLHIGGCRKTMFDSHLKGLANRCPRLLELHLSDCRRITEETLLTVCTFKQLRGLSLLRCYAIGDSVYIRLRSTPKLARLRVFGALTDRALRLIRNTFTYINVNEYNIVRPATKKRRASI